MIVELHAQIIGRVQGVQFRNKVAKIGRELELTGFVENLSDGSVSIVAQGERKELEQLLKRVQKGFFFTKISGITHSYQPISKLYTSFEVKKLNSFIKDQMLSFKNLSKDLLGLQKEGGIPQHVAIIPDGNRRWARRKGWQAWVGHRMGGEYKRLTELFYECRDVGVKYLSFWGFSTENWKRDAKEVTVLMKLMKGALEKGKDDVMKEGIRVIHIGRKDRLPKDFLKLIEMIEERTKGNDKLTLLVCIDYGGRDEVVRAVNKAIQEGVQSVDEESFKGYLDTGETIPDVDLVIRTGGEKRLSGLYPYQATYAELYFADVLFPDFDADQFKLAILEYGARTRRFGGTAMKDLQEVDVSQLKEPDTETSK